MNLIDQAMKHGRYCQGFTMECCEDRCVATVSGTIKRIMRQTGCGFTNSDDRSEDLFFHRGSMAPRGQIEDLNEGDTVELQSRKGDRGLVEFDVKVR